MESLERAFGILQIVADARDGIGVTRISEEMGLAKSTTSRFLAGLEAQGALVRSAENTFTIGPTLLRLTAQQPYAQTLSAIAQPFLQQLSQETGEAVALCVPDGNYVHYLTQVQSNHAVQVRDWTGARLPLNVLAAGKLFLAFGSAEFIDAYLRTPLVKSTRHSLDSAARLRHELKTVRDLGYASSNEEFARGLVGHAAPVFDADSQIVAAVNLFGPKFRFDSFDKVKGMVEQMCRTAGALSMRLGYNPIHA